MHVHYSNRDINILRITKKPICSTVIVKNQDERGRGVGSTARSRLFSYIVTCTKFIISIVLLIIRCPFREKPPSDTGRVYTLKVITIYLYNVFGREEVNSVVRNSHRVQIPEHLSCGDAWNEPIPPAGGPLARPVLKQHTE